MKKFSIFILLGLSSTQAFAFPVTTSIRFTGVTIYDSGDGGTFPGRGLQINGETITDCVDPTGPVICTADLTPYTGSGQSISYGYANGTRVNAFSYSSDTSNVLNFGPDNAFTLGSITYTNGWFYFESAWDFELTTHSDFPLFDGHVFQGRLHLFAPDNHDGEPERSADYFFIEDAAGQALQDIGSARVYDYAYCPDNDPTAPACNTGSVDIIGHINSLHIDALANPSGGAFISPSLDPLDTPVDEPPAFWLTLAGLAAVGASRRKKSSH